MLLFQKRFHEGLVNGSVTLTFRRWPTPRVKVGGRYRVHPIGVVVCEGLERVTVGDITDLDAQRSGFERRTELLSYFEAQAPVAPSTEVFKVQLRHGGDGDYVESAKQGTLTATDLAALTKKLARLDRDGPWTLKVLRMIARRPKIAASKLAAALGREKLAF